MFKQIKLHEAKGRVLGVVPEQIDSAQQLIRSINRAVGDFYSINTDGRHIHVVHVGSGKSVTTFTRGPIGPRAAKSTLSTIRAHAVGQGHIELDPNEITGIQTRRRGSFTVVSRPSAIPERSPTDALTRWQQIKDAVASRQGALGAKRLARMERAKAKLGAFLASKGINPKN